MSGGEAQGASFVLSWVETLKPGMPALAPHLSTAGPLKRLQRCSLVPEGQFGSHCKYEVRALK